MTFMSKNFYGAGTFNGQDNLVTLSDGVNINTNLVKPWESVPIKIRGIGVVVFQNKANLNYCLAGNSFIADIMSAFGPSEMGRPVFFPDDCWFDFPAASNPTTDPHIDCHVSGTSGAFQLFYTVYYNK